MTENEKKWLDESAALMAKYVRSEIALADRYGIDRNNAMESAKGSLVSAVDMHDWSTFNPETGEAEAKPGAFANLLREAIEALVGPNVKFEVIELKGSAPNQNGSKERL